MTSCCGTGRPSSLDMSRRISGQFSRMRNLRVLCEPMDRTTDVRVVRRFIVFCNTPSPRPDYRRCMFNTASMLATSRCRTSVINMQARKALSISSKLRRLPTNALIKSLRLSDVNPAFIQPVAGRGAVRCAGCSGSLLQPLAVA